jgi:hypothetical protein
MFRFLSTLLTARAGSARRKPAPASKKARVAVEALEDRFLLSISPMLSKPILSTAQSSYAAPSASIPNLVGVSFYLSTVSNPYSGVVTIQSETPFSDVMKITGTWDLESAGTKNNQFSGDLGIDPFGNLQIDITDGSNVLIADITKVYSRTAVGQYAYFGYNYSLNGSLNGSQVTGWGQPPPPMFALPY